MGGRRRQRLSRSSANQRSSDVHQRSGRSERVRARNRKRRHNGNLLFVEGEVKKENNSGPPVTFSPASSFPKSRGLIRISAKASSAFIFTQKAVGTSSASWRHLIITKKNIFFFVSLPPPQASFFLTIRLIFRLPSNRRQPVYSPRRGNSKRGRSCAKARRCSSPCAASHCEKTSSRKRERT